MGFNCGIVGLPNVGKSTLFNAITSGRADASNYPFCTIESGLTKVVHEGYAFLRLITFYTAGPKEVRAWTVPHGTVAPAAAGVIHSDFEKGFIRAEIIKSDDLLSLRSEAPVRDAGLLAVEGKEYLMQDGDIARFRFSV